MKNDKRHGAIGERRRLLLIPSALLCLFVASASAQAFTVNVVDQDKNPVAGFKWLLEEDNTHAPEPGVHKPVSADVAENTLSISIHKSHAPSVASGFTDDSSLAIDTIDLPGGTVPLPAGRYFISVLPFGTADTTYDLGGTSIDTTTQSEVTVFVKANPIETAQISVKVFHDIAPLNNAPDATEAGLEGFTVTLMEAAGDVLQDAFGNPLGTTYLPNGDIDQIGSGDFVTDANGEVLIQNLAPNKYGIQVEPPTTDGMGNPVKWYQTTTIEGTHTIDAWVRPNEPPFLVEFGPPFWHAFYGFVQEMDELDPMGGPATTVTGQVRKGHLSRPPAIAFFDGAPPSTSACLIGLNHLQGTVPEVVWVGRCEDDGYFSIPNVPPGTYQLVIWDVFLDHIISFNTVIAPDTGGVLDLGTLATPMWFGEQEHWVYFDANKNGVRDPGEVGIPEQNVNLRFRDGTIYQAFPTDREGYVPFEEVFPFFHWQVAEVDFARLEATGLSVVVDQGGPVTNDQYGEGKRTPPNPPLQTETGPVLLSGYQQFAGQNTRFEWGKAPYDRDVNVPPLEDFPGPGDDDVNSDGEYGNNGGISGIVYHATTRAEDDPAFAAAEEWEPGIPRVQVNLYRDQYNNETGMLQVNSDGSYGDGQPDPVDANGNPDAGGFPHVAVFADVDNAPFGWRDDPLANGPEDIDHDLDGVFDAGDAIRVVTTDSWDDNLPESCTGNVDPLEIHGAPVPISQCAEGLRTWNQARPALFDGGFAFGPGDPLLVPGGYLVEAVAPPAYKHIKEEDRNVDFGLTPIPAILPPPCAGDLHEVPPYFSFATRDGSGAADQLLPWADPGDVEVPAAGEMKHLCDRKSVTLASRQNAAAEFFLFNDVPKAARAVGLITDDFANELAPGKPSFTEKFSPPWISIAVFDYTGREILRTSGDEFGAYNFLVPSTYAIDLPTPSGVGPKMHHYCLNDPGPVPDGNGGFITDPLFNPQYSTTCYTFNFEPGRTTYLDTPVIRIAAFVGALQQTLDCEEPEGTPMIRSVLGPAGAPAFIQGDGDVFTITSMGQTDVPNPAYPGDNNNDGIPDDPPTEPEFVSRNFGFAGSNSVTVGDYTFPNSAVSSTADSITVSVPTSGYGPGGSQGPVEAGLLTTGQLTVTKGGGGNSTPFGVTLTVGNSEPGTMAVLRVPGEYDTIQAAIDAADEDDLILVDPGIYRELPIVYKRVRLQGAGGNSTHIEASHFSAGPGFANPLVAWRDKLAELVGDPNDSGDDQIGLLPEQDPANPTFFLQDGEGPGILVSPLEGEFATGAPARIDGFDIGRADLGGAIYVNTFADRLQISNNRLQANNGNLGGGIRVGNPTVVAFARGGVAVEASPNPNLDIHHNQVLQNGSNKPGGGVALFKGASHYEIADNTFCGNFARSGGGAIAHRGLSDGGLIARNKIVFNEVFQGDQPGAGLGIGGGGGGVEIAGDPDALGGLSEGTGDVTIDRNLFQGNLGGAADGGAIALRNVNGDDVSADPTDDADWHRIRIFNNLIVNNVTGVAGGGISLQDALRVSIVHNTVAHNDSTATGIFAFEGGPTEPTTPQVAGIVSRAHSTALANVIPLAEPAYSNPEHLLRNILWENRTFYWDASADPNLQPDPASEYHDLGVAGTVAPVCLDPQESFLTSLTCDTGDPFDGSNQTTNGPNLLEVPYFNDLVTAAAADEGGNFVQVYYTPLGVTGDYHIPNNSPARNKVDEDDLPAGLNGLLAVDFDGEDRPAEAGNNRVDIGADEYQ